MSKNIDYRLSAKEFVRKAAKMNSVLPSTQEAARNLYVAANKINNKRG